MRLSAIAWLALVTVLLGFKVIEAAMPQTSDQGLFNYAARAILRGQAPYRDVFDVKPPAVFYLRALILSVVPDAWDAKCLPGPVYAPCPIIAIQVADFVWTLLLALLLQATAGLCGIGRWASFAAGALGALSISLVNLSSLGFTPEKLGLVPATLAVYSALRATTGGVRWWALAGASAAGATLCIQSAATVLLPVGVLALGRPPAAWRQRGSRLLWVTGGFAAPLLAAAILLQWAGILAPWFEASVLVNVRRFGVDSALGGFGGQNALSSAWRTFREGSAPFWLLGWMGALAALGDRRRALVALVLWAAFDTATLLRLRDYLRLSPSYALLGAYALERLWAAAGSTPYLGLGSRWAARLSLVSLLGSVVALSWMLQGSVAMRFVNDRGVRGLTLSAEEWVADSVRRLPAGPMFIWGNGAQIYLRANRQAVSRFVNGAGLGAGSPGVREHWEELFADLARTPPAVIAIDPRSERDTSAAYARLMRFLQTSYDRAPSSELLGGWTLFVRRPGAP